MHNAQQTCHEEGKKRSPSMGHNPDTVHPKRLNTLVYPTYIALHSNVNCSYHTQPFKVFIAVTCK